MRLWVIFSLIIVAVILVFLIFFVVITFSLNSSAKFGNTRQIGFPAEEVIGMSCEQFYNDKAYDTSLTSNKIRELCRKACSEMGRFNSDHSCEPATQTFYCSCV